MDDTMDLSEIMKYASTFRIGDDILIERRDPDANVWAIYRCGHVMNQSGKWEFEPMPSNRTEDFLERTRFTLSEAFELAMNA